MEMCGALFFPEHAARVAAADTIVAFKRFLGRQLDILGLGEYGSLAGR